MRILFVSNLYPGINQLGGYEQWCQEVAAELMNRGHHVRVLTSRSAKRSGYALDRQVEVQALLHLEVPLEDGLVETTYHILYDRKRREKENLHHVLNQVREYRPDAILIWGMWNIPRSTPRLVEALMKDCTAYYFCDYWPTLKNVYIQQWEGQPGHIWMSAPKRWLSGFMLKYLQEPQADPLQLTNAMCVSAAVRSLLVKGGAPVSNAIVIHGGTDTEEFLKAAQARPVSPGKPLKLLYLGRLQPEKGLRTMLSAMTWLPSEGCATLDLVGKGTPEYTALLREMVRQNRLENMVRFLPPVFRSEVPHLLAQYDVLVFPSEWEEPFARAVLEAMAAGLVVIGTTTGGTGEILQEGVTGLTFPAGDDCALAGQIERLANDIELWQRLSVTGQQRVVTEFTLTCMVDGIEKYLLQLTGRQPAPSMAQEIS